MMQKAEIIIKFYHSLLGNWDKSLERDCPKNSVALTNGVEHFEQGVPQCKRQSAKSYGLLCKPVYSILPHQIGKLSY